MDLKQLSFFAEVARRASFTKAAQQLCVVQSAVSIAIKKLEADLGLALFNRVGKKVSLTAEGKVLLEHAHRIIDQFQSARQAMDELKGLEKGVVRIGLPSLLGTYYFPDILADFKRRYPNLRLSVYEAGARQLQQMIHEGELDMGIVVRDELPENLEARGFLKEEMVACVAPGHPFAGASGISHEEFLRQELVLFKEDYFHREFINRISHRLGQSLDIVVETNLVPLIISTVAQGSGITTFLRMVADATPGLVAVPFNDPVYLELCIAWKKDAFLAKADQAFIEFLLQWDRIDCEG